MSKMLLNSSTNIFNSQKNFFRGLYPRISIKGGEEAGRKKGCVMAVGGWTPLLSVICILRDKCEPVQSASVSIPSK